MDNAIEKFVDVVSKEVNPEIKHGYTFLRWNGKYGREAKFVVRDNINRLQSIFIPGRTQDVLWTSVDLANAPEIKGWSDFCNETVDDLELIAF